MPISSGLRPGNDESGYNFKGLLKLFGFIILVMFIGGWLLIEIFGGIFGIKIESFQQPPPSLNPASYYKEVPSPANKFEHPDSLDYEADNSYDSGILRANRYYTIDQNKTPVSSLFSLNNEIPSTYMLTVLNKVQSTQSSFEIANDPGVFKLAPAYLSKLTQLALEEEPALTALFNIIRLYVITKINLVVLDEKLSDSSHPFQPFKVIKSRNTFLRVLDVNNINNGLELITDMMLYRTYKTHTFNIQAKILIKPADNNKLSATIQQLVLVGTTISGEVSEINEANNNVDSPVLPYSSSSSYGGNNGSAPVAKPGPATRFFGSGIADIALGDYSAGSVELDKNIAEYERRKKLKQADSGSCSVDSPTAQGFRYMLYENSRAALDRNLRQPRMENGAWTNTDPAIEEKVRRYLEVGCGRCFGVNPETNEIIDLIKYNDDKIACESKHDELGGEVGIWDTPCKADTDCPYFQANKNYPNTFGKCIKTTGTCEMPVGAIRMGYKLEHKKSQPRCNNCDKIRGYNVSVERDDICCTLQSNKLDEMGINSPDYRFAGDLFERRKSTNKAILEAAGLTP